MVFGCESHLFADGHSYMTETGTMHNTVGQDLIITEILILWFRFYTSCSKQSKFISRLLDVSYIFDVIVNKMPTCWHIFFIFTPLIPRIEITYNCRINLNNFITICYNGHILVKIFSNGNVHCISSPSSDSCFRNCEAFGNVVAP